MSLLISDCPRCGAKEHTFDVLSTNRLYTLSESGWEGTKPSVVAGHVKKQRFLLLDRAALSELTKLQILE